MEMRTMLTAVLLVTTSMLYGQVPIQNVDFTQKGKKIYISYDIQSEGRAFLDVYYSTNDGSTWHGPVQHVRGDLKSVQSGTGKQIIWNVLEDRDWLIAENFRIKLKGEFTVGAFTDSRDGQTYKWVTIGNQVWMVENLNYDAGNGCWCYDDNSHYCNEYGRLYNWEIAQKSCPDGWHLPSKSEFETLLNQYGGKGEQAYTELQNVGSSGFSTLFGGWRRYDGSFSDFGRLSGFWSSSLDGSSQAWLLYSNSSFKAAYMGSSKRIMGLSIRCLQD